MKLKLIFILFYIVSYNKVISKDYWADFQKLIMSTDLESLDKFLKNWEKENNTNPQLYVAYFNFFLQQVMKDVTVVFKKPKYNFINICIENVDEKSYIYDDILIDSKSKCFNSAIKYINIGIKLHPNRLDMRFGKIYAFIKARKYDNATNEIIKTIQQSNKNNNEWFWNNGEKLEKSPDFMLNIIQEYIIEILNSPHKKAETYVKKISEIILKYYPKNVVSIVNLGLITKTNNDALVLYKRALEIAPNDPIILANIGYIYEKQNNKNLALNYYKLAEEFGDEHIKKIVKEHIQKIISTV